MPEYSGSLLPDMFDNPILPGGMSKSAWFFTLTSTITNVQLTMSVTGSASNLTFPCYLMFLDTGEIVRATSISGTTITLSGRAQRSTSAASHTAGAGIVALSNLLGTIDDHRTLQISANIDNAVTSFAVLGTLGFECPAYFLTVDASPEIMLVYGAKADLSGASGTLYQVTRGARGTTAASHLANTNMILVLSGKHLNQLRDAIIAAQKYQALVGSSLKPSPHVGEVFVISSTSVHFATGTTLANGSFSRVDLVEHDQLTNLSNDDHTQYHNDARASTWHGGLSGGHVLDGDSHDHLKGAGVARLVAGTSKPTTPSYNGQVYYDTATNILHVGNSSTWVPISGAPSGAIAMFDEAAIASFGGACPQGWTRFTDLDSRFPVGAPAGKTGSGDLTTVGSSTHTHTYTDVVAHSHTVPSVVASTNNTGSHSHNLKEYNAVSGTGGIADNGSIATESTGTAGSHSHTFTYPEHTTDTTKRSSDDASGVVTGTSGSVSNLPPYKTVIFCKKN